MMRGGRVFQSAQFVGPISNILKRFPDGLHKEYDCAFTHNAERVNMHMQ